MRPEVSESLKRPTSQKVQLNTLSNLTKQGRSSSVGSNSLLDPLKSKVDRSRTVASDKNFYHSANLVCSVETSLFLKKPNRLRNLGDRKTLESRFKLLNLKNISSNRLSNKFLKTSIEGQLKKTRKWICYGKRVGTQSLKTGSKIQSTEGEQPNELNLDSAVPMTKLIYDQQNMMKCFQERNFYRLLFALFDSMSSNFVVSSPGQVKDSTRPEVQLAACLQNGEKLKILKSKSGSISGTQKISSKKLILFARSEVKRIFRKVLFMKTESILFSQIFLIPLAGFFGVLYTFWTFSVSATVTLKDYIPIAHQRMSPIAKRLQNELKTNSPGRTSSVTRSLEASNQRKPTFLSGEHMLDSFVDWADLSSEGTEEGTFGLAELPFFTSYKVDWSPTRGLADFLRFTNTASKIFILWASLTVFRSLRPVKANRPEMRIQTRFLRPLQNRKRFRDLEGIEKFSGVLMTLTESIQGSFKDPLFYLVLALPNLPFFQPFQKAIGKFRFFLFYGKETEFLRKPMTFMIGIFSPKQKQSQTYPKGYLFIGPPGTGKTLLAQAIAGESKVNLICLSASEIQKQLDIGTRIGALRLRNLFEEARTLTPCILFFDEIDTLGRARQGLSQGGQGQMENGTDLTKGGQEIDLKLFTEFLVQMDSFSVKDGFLVIGTTNFLSSLDPAFVRSGRFDRILGLTYPPKQTRIAILKLHIKKKGNLFDKEIPWNIFGLKTKDLSPADLAKVVNESSLYLLNQGNEKTLESKSQLVQKIAKDLFVFQPGLIHTSRSLREGLVKILESKK